MRATVKLRFVLLIATAAVAPLLVYGYVSVASLQTGTRQSVITGNQRVATRAAEQIQQYVDANVKLLRSLGDDLRNTRLEPWQQDRVIKNHVIDFPEFREITLFDGAGRALATSRIGSPQLEAPAADVAFTGDSHISPITIDDDLLPTATVTLKLQGNDGQQSWLVGELNLEELWRMIDRIRVGQEGFALLVAGNGELVAHGNPDEKPRVAQGESLVGHPLVAKPEAKTAAPRPSEAQYLDRRGRQMLGAAAPIGGLGWTVIVEQPTDEAYALATQLQRLLTAAIFIALIVTIVAGYLWARSFIRPIFTLMRGTQALAEGRLDERVSITTRDEFRQLGDAFNYMADKLVELQENVRRQERQAMFGRVAAGLVHDLTQPIQNVGNSCQLMFRMFDDKEYRETFRRTVDREIGTVKRVLDDLRHLARPAPLQRVPVNVNRSVFEVVESMQPMAEASGLTLIVDAAAKDLVIEADQVALGRVYRNLITNAIQATRPGGRVTITTSDHGQRARVTVADTGCGIPPDRIGAIFEDFVTTKRRGLGLGLAISKKIVEQLDGTISVSSEVEKGTTFVLEFPKVVAPSRRTAAVAG